MSRFVMIQKCLLAFLLLSAFDVKGGAQSTSIPQTPAGEALGAWLRAINSDDRSVTEDYVSRIDTTETCEDLVTLHDETGGFNVVSIESFGPRHLRFVVKDKNGGESQLGNLWVTKGTPSRVEILTLRPLPHGEAPTYLTLDEPARKRLLDSVEVELRQEYVYLPVAEDMIASIRSKEHAGEYKEIEDSDVFADRITKDLRKTSHDIHLRLEFTPFGQSKARRAPSDDEVARARTQTLHDNCAFTDVRILPNNVGYLKFNAFLDPQTCAPIVKAAMTFVAHSAALIVDLRDNGGGDPVMVSYIASYLFDKPTHLNDLYYRKDNIIRQFWTVPVGAAEQLLTQPVYILTSKSTISGAEEFSYDLKAQKRATIVGETTGGGAHPMHGHSVADHFILYVPVARPINPITGTDWEGRGVIPDVGVSSTDALLRAERLAAEQIRQLLP